MTNCLLCLFSLVALGASADDDFSVVFDRQTYQVGETPRLLVSANAEMSGVSFEMAVQFENGAIVKLDSPNNRLIGDNLGAFFVGAFRARSVGDIGTFRYFVTIGGVTRIAEFKVVSERPTVRCGGDPKVKAGDTVAFQATGGQGKYTWNVPVRSDGGYGFVESSLSKENALFVKVGPPNIGRLERRFVSVTDGSEVGFCLFEVVWP